MILDASAAIELMPGLQIAFLVAKARAYQDGEAEEVSSRILKRVQANYGSLETLKNHTLAEGYKQFYEATNVRPSSASTPLKQAIRVLNNRGYRPIYPVVDICMEIEYASLCSFQVYDLDKLGQKIAYGPASGEESIEGCSPRKGELILTDESGVINSPSCGNDTPRLVTDASQLAMIRILKIPAVTDSVFEAAIKETKQRLEILQEIVLNNNESVKYWSVV